MDITKKLFGLQDLEYAEFQSKLVPTIDRELFIGVRVPVLRKLAKEIINGENHLEFLNELPHRYYDENMLHSIILSELKDYDLCLELVEKFLPYVDNWAVCDSLSPKSFSKHKIELMDKIRQWSSSKKVYTCRFGLEMIMKHFMDEDFKEEYLKIPLAIHSEEYYVNMMIAWLFATSLAKQWDSTILLIENKSLSIWVHNKTIQKACESFRITKEQKVYLRELKIK
ncbi:3-methyladenine DNA glycosylase AlkD [Peptoniphilus asaccharolyticus DSM 20463]|uniref:3-methyladenine DNA glycosylase AlkD n=1 Tax=Peptoniphilus asaccharolyticus DSM 20463 TaxID=573058 RepID=A0A1W1UL56_PEPAS|nr:DNA alkylation repair protein [Peptoniphilus asaccharolyticus]MBL7574861.1 DNA alkylation repair protein [Peptoniphilus asaccharolyticus]SMB81802.1 3-methyladenine DNA glycosylase AlkD [Peptoniphilus asaccharolyticus DSM 20463]